MSIYLIIEEDASVRMAVRSVIVSKLTLLIDKCRFLLSSLTFEII
jgi:hypothetical protein